MSDSKLVLSATGSSESSQQQVFEGFHPLTANFLYCPNQFLDICLKSNSRGMVRIVTYILRQTLGWLDSDGQPINQTVKVTYKELIEKAGVSRGAISKALGLAVGSGFIECCQPPRADAAASPHQSGEYTLQWDNSPAYACTIADFGGFYSGEGYRTQIPNAFFDELIPNESLSVIKVVGAVIRHTVGYQTQFGGRRTTASLSCNAIKNYSKMDKKSAITAIQHAERSGYITKVREGVFSNKPSLQSAAVYSIKWLQQSKNESTGSKILPASQQSKNSTRSGSKIPPGNQFKNSTSIEKTKTKDTLKQQSVVGFSLAQEKLVDAGFTAETARELVEKRGVDVVLRQLNWIDARKPKNRAGLLRKAIEEDWEIPEAFRAEQKRLEDRIRATKKEKLDSAMESKINERKRVRIERHDRLRQIWAIAPVEDRARWIEAAVLAEPTAIMQNIIRRKGPESSKPHFQVLNELERELESRGVNVAKNSTC